MGRVGPYSGIYERLALGPGCYLSLHHYIVMFYRFAVHIHCMYSLLTLYGLHHYITIQ